jgi:cobaltochelatase CobS
MASTTTAARQNVSGMPDIKVSARQVFGIDTDMEVPAFSTPTEHVPQADDAYLFDHDTTMAILAGFAHNRRVMVQGYHGTGKSTHIEQVASRLNWPCLRVNLDSHISRIDLIGKDAIVLRDGKQVTEFREGILPWALQNPTALVFDEYDAGRADVMFVIQRVLEVDGKLTLLDQNKVIHPHPAFRLFATANTVGLGDTTGLYHGTQQINQGQMDRWSIVTTLNYLPHEQEVNIVAAKTPFYNSEEGRECAHLRGRRGLCLPSHLPEQVRRGRAQHARRVLPALLRQGTAVDQRQGRKAALTERAAWPRTPLPSRSFVASPPRQCGRCRARK